MAAQVETDVVPTVSTVSDISAEVDLSSKRIEALSLIKDYKNALCAEIKTNKSLKTLKIASNPIELEKVRETNPYLEYIKPETTSKVEIYTPEDHAIIKELLDLLLCIFYIKLINYNEIKNFSISTKSIKINVSKLYLLCKNPILLDALETHICNKLKLSKNETSIDIVVNLEKNSIYFNINKRKKPIINYTEDPFSIELYAIIDAFNQDIETKHAFNTKYVIELLTKRLFPNYIEYSNDKFFENPSNDKYNIKVDLDEKVDKDYIGQVLYYDDWYKTSLRSIIKDTFNIKDIKSLRITFTIIESQLVIYINRI